MQTIKCVVVGDGAVGKVRNAHACSRQLAAGQGLVNKSFLAACAPLSRDIVRCGSCQDVYMPCVYLHTAHTTCFRATKRASLAPTCGSGRGGDGGVVVVVGAVCRWVWAMSLWVLGRRMSEGYDEVTAETDHLSLPLRAPTSRLRCACSVWCVCTRGRGVVARFLRVSRRFFLWLMKD